MPVPTVWHDEECTARPRDETVSDETRNLADSLDEMLGPGSDEPTPEANEQPADDAPPTEQADAASNGDEFADQVQQMLDEAEPPANSTETDGDPMADMQSIEDVIADDTPIDEEVDLDSVEPFDPAIDELADQMEAADAAKAEPQTDPAPPADGPAGTLDPSDFDAPDMPEELVGDDEAKLISEIDAMLAASADDVVDDEALDVPVVEEQASEPEPAPVAAAEPEPTPAEPIADDALNIDHEMQSVEELISETEQPDKPQPDPAEGPTAKATVPLEAEQAVESPFDGDSHEFDPSEFATAADVGAELDEVEAASSAIGPADEPAPTPAPAPAEAAPAEQVIASNDKADKLNPLIAVMAKINQPVMDRPALVRDTVGCIAIGTLLMAALCWVNGIAGPDVAMFMVAPLMALLLPVVLYYMIFRQHGTPAAKPPADTDDKPDAGDDAPDGAAVT